MDTQGCSKPLDVFRPLKTLVFSASGVATAQAGKAEKRKMAEATHRSNEQSKLTVGSSG